MNREFCSDTHSTHICTYVTYKTYTHFNIFYVSLCLHQKMVFGEVLFLLYAMNVWRIYADECREMLVIHAMVNGWVLRWVILIALCAHIFRIPFWKLFLVLQFHITLFLSPHIIFLEFGWKRKLRVLLSWLDLLYTHRVFIVNVWAIPCTLFTVICWTYALILSLNYLIRKFQKNKTYTNQHSLFH